MKTICIAAAAFVLLLAQPGFAQPTAMLSPNAGRDAGGATASLRGPIVTTGRIGSNLQTTTLPGAGGAGLLMNNGNGTSTLIGPGGQVTSVPTPR